jgi:hypothetical protein
MAVSAATVVESLRSEATRTTTLDALEALAAPIPSAVALAAVPALVDAIATETERATFDRCGLLLARLCAEALPDPTVHAAAVFGDVERLAGLLGAALVAEAVQRATCSRLPPERGCAGAQTPSSLGMSKAIIMAQRLSLAREGDADRLAAHLDATGPEVHIDTADESLPVEKRSNALQAACWAGKVDAVALLLQRGADPNAQRQHNGGTCTCIAAHAGHSAVVTALATGGAELDRPNTNGASPVFIAAEHGHTGALCTLLTLGADPDEADRQGCSPCYIAASRGHVDCLDMLRAHGADLDAAAKEDHAAPLHIAVARGRLSAFVMLLDAGARTDQPVLRQGGPGVSHPSWTLRQLIMAKFGLHANTRQAFLEPLSVAEEVAPLVAAAQRLAWMGRRIGVARGGERASAHLTLDLKRLVGQRMLPQRARLDVAKRAAVQWLERETAKAEGGGGGDDDDDDDDDDDAGRAAASSQTAMLAHRAGGAAQAPMPLPVHRGDSLHSAAAKRRRTSAPSGPET